MISNFYNVQGMYIHQSNTKRMKVSKNNNGILFLLYRVEVEKRAEQQKINDNILYI